MFVTNLAKHPLGVDGIIILDKEEQNRFIEDKKDLVQRVKRLEAVGLVTVSYEEGLTKDGNPVELEPAETPVEVEEPAEEPAEEVSVEEVPAAKPKRGARSAK